MLNSLVDVVQGFVVVSLVVVMLSQEVHQPEPGGRGFVPLRVRVKGPLGLQVGHVAVTKLLDQLHLVRFGVQGPEIHENGWDTLPESLAEVRLDQLLELVPLSDVQGQPLRRLRLGVLLHELCVHLKLGVHVVLDLLGPLHEAVVVVVFGVPPDQLGEDGLSLGVLASLYEQGALGLVEVRLITDLLLVEVEVVEGGLDVPGLLEYGVLVQEELAVLVEVVAGLLSCSWKKGIDK